MKKLLIALIVTLTSIAAYAQSPAGQGEFVPASSLPPTDQLPAAPLLIAAYAFAWIAVFFFVWTVWRRLSTVEREMRSLEQRQSRGQPR